MGLDSHARNVWLKAYKANNSSLSIVCRLSTDPLRADSRNHTIPHLDFLSVGEWCFAVECAWGSNWNGLPFDSMGTRLELARQLLEVNSPHRCPQFRVNALLGTCVHA